MSRKHAPGWRTDRNRWLDANPYEGPYDTPEEADDWAIRIRRVHSDKFTVMPVEGGFEVTQDVPEQVH